MIGILNGTIFFSTTQVDAAFASDLSKLFAVARNAIQARWAEN